MKKIIIFLIFIVLFLTGCSDNELDGKAKLTFRVWDRFSKENLSDAIVVVDDTVNTSDEYGYCDFVVEPGTHKVTGILDGYKTRSEYYTINDYTTLCTAISLYPDVPIEGQITYSEEIDLSDIRKKTMIIEYIENEELFRIEDDDAINDDLSFSIEYSGRLKLIKVEIITYGEYQPDNPGYIKYTDQIEITPWEDVNLDVDNVIMDLELGGFSAAPY